MSLPLRVRSRKQADAFRMEPTSSMRYVLLLGGTPVSAIGRPQTIDELLQSSRPSNGAKWLLDTLQSFAPEVLPGKEGPVIITLIL
jgi:hypothetical protein